MEPTTPHPCPASLSPKDLRVLRAHRVRHLLAYPRRLSPTCLCRKPPYRLAVASVTSDAAATLLARALAAAAAALPVGMAAAPVVPAVVAAPSAPVFTVSLPAEFGEVVVVPFVAGRLVGADAVGVAGAPVVPAVFAPAPAGPVPLFFAAFASRLRG